MLKQTKLILFLLSLIFTFVFFYRSLNTPNPQNKNLVEDYKIQKMNLYPPQLFRLANIIESRPEFSLYFRLEKNFTEIFNFSKLYSNYLELFVFLSLLVIICRLFINRPRLALTVSLSPLVVLSLFPGTKEDIFFVFLPLILLSLLSKYVKE